MSPVQDAVTYVALTSHPVGDDVPHMLVRGVDHEIAETWAEAKRHGTMMVVQSVTPAGGKDGLYRVVGHLRLNPAMVEHCYTHDDDATVVDATAVDQADG